MHMAKAVLGSHNVLQILLSPCHALPALNPAALMLRLAMC